MSITGVVQDGCIRLPIPIPDGTEVEITLPGDGAESTATGAGFAARYAKHVGIADEFPEDFAANHDHYLHGGAKRV